MQAHDDATADVAGLMAERLAEWIRGEGHDAGRELLAGMALLPQPSPLDLLLRIVDEDTPELLASAAFAGLVLERPGEGLEFTTPALREPAAALATDGLVLRTARALQAGGGEARGLHTARLLVRAGEGRDAFDVAMAWGTARSNRDGAAASAAFDTADAACELLDAPARGPRRTRLAIERARLARTLGDIALAERVIDGLGDLEEPDVLELRATVQVIRGRLGDAIAIAERCGRLFEERGDSVGAARAVLVHAQARFNQQPSATTLAEFESADRLARASGDARVSLQSRWRLARARRTIGQVDAARSELEDALQQARELGAVSTEGTVLRELANTLHELGDHANASARLEESLQCLERGGFRATTASARVSLGEMARIRGDLVRARDELSAGLSLARAYGQRGDAVVASLNLAFVELEQGRTRAVARRLRAVDELLPPDVSHGLRPWVEALRLVVLCQAADWESAEDRFEDLAERIGALEHLDKDLILLLRHAAQAAADGGEGSLAADTVELARDLARRADDADAEADLSRFSTTLFG